MLGKNGDIGMSGNGTLVIFDDGSDKVANVAEEMLLKHADLSGKPFVESPLSLTAVFSENTDKPVAYLEGVSMQGRFYLSRLAVDEALRGKNIGRTLMKKLEEIATSRGDAEVVLDTWSFQAE